MTQQNFDSLFKSKIYNLLKPTKLDNISAMNTLGPLALCNLKRYTLSCF